MTPESADVLDAPAADPLPAPEAPGLDPELAVPSGDGAPAGDALLADTMALLADVELEVTVELGRRRLPLSEVARLRVGSVVELDTQAGDPLAIYANGRRIATGEAVVVDGQLGIRVTTLEGSRR